MATIYVTKEKCKKCLYGYPCVMWDELSLPMEGERCDNFEENTTMAKFKSYTDISQSTKLATILPLESADMSYSFNFDSGIHEISTASYESWIIPKYAQPDNGFGKVIPCWSLAALYSILPNNKKESTILSRGGWNIEPIDYIDNWWCEYEDDNHDNDFTVSADNPVDACVNMIEKLHELKLL